MALKRVVEQDTLRLMDGDTELMAMEESADGNTVSVSLRGNLRSETALDFQDELCALATLGMDVTLDFEQVQYLSVACQRALETVQQKMDTMKKGSLVLTRLSQALLSALEETGMTELLQIKDE